MYFPSVRRPRPRTLSLQAGQNQRYALLPTRESSASQHSGFKWNQKFLDLQFSAFSQPTQVLLDSLFLIDPAPNGDLSPPHPPHLVGVDIAVDSCSPPVSEVGAGRISLIVRGIFLLEFRVSSSLSAPKRPPVSLTRNFRTRNVATWLLKRVSMLVAAYMIAHGLWVAEGRGAASCLRL